MQECVNAMRDNAFRCLGVRGEGGRPNRTELVVCRGRCLQEIGEKFHKIITFYIAFDCPGAVPIN